MGCWTQGKRCLKLILLHQEWEEHQQGALQDGYVSGIQIESPMLAAETKQG